MQIPKERHKQAQEEVTYMEQLKIHYVKLGDLVPNPRNSRTHSEKQIKKLASLIKEFGFNDPVHIGKDNVLICGHARLQAAKLAGLEALPTIHLGHLNEMQQLAYLIAHNRVAIEAGWDNAILAEDLAELRDMGFDLELTAFDNDEIIKLAPINDKDMGLTDDDDVPDLGASYSPTNKPGDIWILGDHRLMCGDSTMVDSVDALMADHSPHLMVTDPPYGVNYDPEWREDVGVNPPGATSKGKVENDDRKDWTDAYSLFRGDIMYIWHDGIHGGDIASHIKDCGFDIISQIIWAKQHFVFSRCDYHWQHEPCWYAVRKGQNHQWQGSRNQSTIWNIANNKNSFGAPPEKTWGHGTQKPIDCMARPIENNSKLNDYVYDPFGGSGTTLIACEKLSRKCLMMELSPVYCDVIIKRWQEHTGKKAIHEASKLTFDGIADE